MSKPRLIAFYLPQFYPTPENNEWWQPGFTEWTNVGNAKPLFKGHYQPKVPADLGYYDLRVPEVREQQTELAKEAGIEGFCYWHYWFNGRRLLDRVFCEVVENGKPNYPFCLCWANHSWYQKTWDSTKNDKLLIEQTYPGAEDYIAHFNAMLPAFKDERYMKVDGKLIFGIYSLKDIPDFSEFQKIWNMLARQNGLKGFFFLAFTFTSEKVDPYINMGVDGVIFDSILYTTRHQSEFENFKKKLMRKVFNKVYKTDYVDYFGVVKKTMRKDDKFYPCIVPNFDHSPRSGINGTILINSSPFNWYKLCQWIFTFYKNRPKETNLVFIKAWNEWGEGNYLEPDLKYGKDWIKAIKRALADIDI